MTVIISGGYLILGDGTDTMEIKTEKILVDWVWQPTIDHFAGGAGNAYDIDDQYLIFKAQGIYFDSHTDFDTFVGNLRTWHKAGDLELEVKRDSTNKIAWDGTNTKYDVWVANGLKGMEGIGAQTIDVFSIKSIIFESV